MKSLACKRKLTKVIMLISNLCVVDLPGEQSRRHSVQPSLCRSNRRVAVGNEAQSQRHLVALIVAGTRVCEGQTKLYNAITFFHKNNKWIKRI